MRVMIWSALVGNYKLRHTPGALDNTTQNQPGTIRDIYIPSAGYVLFAADYEQLEMRILAHFSKEPTLTNAILSGKDVHSTCAAQMFKVSYDELQRVKKLADGPATKALMTKEEKDLLAKRQGAKTINFGGMKPIDFGVFLMYAILVHGRVHMLLERTCVTCGATFAYTRGRTNGGRVRNTCDHCREIAKEACEKAAMDNFRRRKGQCVGMGSGGNQIGEKNPQWRGGHSKYRKILIAHLGGHFPVECSDCHVMIQSKRDLCAHHIDHDRANPSPANLKPVCKRCHQMVEHAPFKNEQGQFAGRSKTGEKIGDTPMGAIRGEGTQ